MTEEERAPRPTEEEGELIGKVDRVAERVSDTMAEGRESPDVEGRGLSPSAPAAPESGEGSTLVLDGDDERRLQVGEELAVRLRSGAPGAWTYEIEGDARALDISERAEVVSVGGGRSFAPGSSGGSQFLLRASRKGKATVRFEGPAGAVRLRIKVG